ncbi:MAG TPA: TonB-dependent receptor [Blastocatellia bacterium]|nr:TonB-dependent receptor [Blastocatellia bacterium]
MKRLIKVLAVTLILFVLEIGVCAQTQSTTGVIQGTVLDPQGGVVPDAKVEVKNPDTNFSRSFTTDSDGRFVFLQLSPGRYNLTAAKQGFATVIQENLELTVGQTINLTLNMKVTQLEEKITITAAPTIDSVKTESSSTLNELAVSNLPILGRKFEDLLTLTPGVSIVQGPDGDEINFAGQRGIFNNISLDGGDYNNGFFGEQAGGQRAAVDITLEAVKEFQVIATGAGAEFGRTAGGIVNVITKSGTNNFHGSLFHFQRLEALSADTSDGKPLTDFHREQFGGTIGGPIIKDKVFFFGAVEQIFANLERPNLSEPIGTPCPVSAPTVPANESLINTNPDCQRLALINFIQTKLGQDEGLPIRHPSKNTAVLTKVDWNVSANNKLGASYNFDYSRNENQTFDVATYGTSANGTEGPSKINVFNLNLFSTLSPTRLNEAHFTYARESRPRSATPSNLPADTGMGFVPTFRFGNPFFLQPNVDELIWRTQLRDSFSIVTGRHTFKFGGEWMHTLNDQVFRGFFTARYLFDSVSGFLRYASPTAPGGFGPGTVACSNGTFVTLPGTCGGGSTPTGGPLLFYLQDGIPSGLPDQPPPGASTISNNDFALFAQDKWQIKPYLTINYGLRWEAQIFPNPITDPSKTAYGQFLNDPRFPSDGTLPDQKKEFQPRVGFAWDISKAGKSVLRASWGIYNARQNMLSQVGSITTNGAQQRTSFATTENIGLGFATAPVWPGLAPVGPPPPAGQFPLFTGVRVFSRDYANPRIYTTNVAFEQEIAPNWAVYADFTHAKGVHLTRFTNINVGSGPAICCAISNTVQIFVPSGDSAFYSGPSPFAPQLGDVFVTNSSAKSLYRGFTVGVRKRFSNRYQLEGNYVYSKDLDDDSNERDPFTDRAFNRFDFSKEYSNSDRDIRHKFNLYSYAEIGWGLEVNGRMQARSAQPITPSPRVLNGVDRGRNSIRKDNEFFSFDWRLQRPFKFGDRMTLMPIIEMFNTFNNDNNVNPLVSPALFNFDGFLRFGVGDPRQLQLALKFTF